MEINSPKYLYQYYLIQESPDSDKYIFKMSKENILESKDAYISENAYVRKCNIGKIREGVLYLLEENKDKAKEIFIEELTKNMDSYQKELDRLQLTISKIQSHIDQLNEEQFEYEK